jgi:Suppressor of fused protein (SUFU)
MITGAGLIISRIQREPAMQASEQTPENDDWQRVWESRLEALEGILGESTHEVYSPIVPFYLCDIAAVLTFPHHVPGFTHVTADLTDNETDQKPNSLGNYELMICTRSDVPAARTLISRLARYTCDELLEPNDTMDIKSFFGDATIRALLFTHPSEGPVHFQLAGRQCGLLLCIGITEDELAFKQANDCAALLAKLRAAGVFPYTIPGRASLIDQPTSALR